MDQYGGRMTRFKSLYITLVLLAATGVLFQNCVAAQSERLPASDRVDKIDGSTSLDESDDVLVLNDIEQKTDGLALLLAPAFEPDFVNLKSQIDSCRKSVGADKKNCIWDIVRMYYTLIDTSDIFIVLPEQENCIMAVSKVLLSTGEPVKIDITCKRDFATDHTGPALLSLGECISLANGSTGTLQAQRSRHFQRLATEFSYGQPGNKDLHLFARDLYASQNLVDACGKTRPVIDLYSSIQISVE